MDGLKRYEMILEEVVDLIQELKLRSRKELEQNLDTLM